ncbi:hypothetical protein [Bacillus sp. FSL E2-8887]|uniref:hypothetical protein n=1 Tax=Bacillus sp. FSL E2-8887 TaxID=2954599 RepID=UPI0030FC8B97
MSLRKRIMACMAVLSLSVGLFAPTSLASELDQKKENLKKYELQKEFQIKDINERYANDIEVRDRLIKKINNDEMLDNINPDKKDLGIEKKIGENTTITTFPDGSTIVSGMDLSNATILDSKGKVIKGPNDAVTGGNWSSGSGFKCVKNAKVENSIGGNYDMYYYADFCIHQGKSTPDILQRVFGFMIKTPDGDFDMLEQGVFRGTEIPGSYSAYGGYKIKYTRYDSNGIGSARTVYVYLRVGQDTYWEDKSL